jgi:hypothetical protein
MRTRNLSVGVGLWLLVLVWWSFALWALPNEIEYTISAQLDIAQNIITGTEIVRFTNRTGTELKELYFHMVPNAFKRGANTKYQQELQRAGIFPTLIYASPDDDAFMEIKSITANGQALSFTLDDTLMRVALPKPLADGETLELQIEFLNDLMQPTPGALWAASFAVRSGHRNGTYTVTLWYPKVVVYDADEGWNLDKYSFLGEFYGDFANYDVTLTVPANFVVGCTGVILSETVQGTQKIVKVRAERVHDFAWVAGPFYRVEETTLSNGSQLRVLSLGFNMTATAADAMNFFNERFGPYAYPVVTVAQVTVGGGMEYPGIVMIAGGSVTEIVHELAHQWWYAAVGNDEMDEAWLDEAFATFSEELYDIERRQAPLSSRSSYNFREPGIPVLTRADQFPSLRSYAQAVYTKGSGVLWMLRWVCGRGELRSSDERVLRTLHVQERDDTRLHRRRRRSLCSRVRLVLRHLAAHRQDSRLFVAGGELASAGRRPDRDASDDRPSRRGDRPGEGRLISARRQRLRSALGRTANGL